MSEIWNEQLQDIICYLDTNLSDPVARYIFEKEIRLEGKPELIDVKQSKWYRQLVEEQLENGSWGRFHTQDTKRNDKQRFSTTEAALRRAKDLDLDCEDPMIEKAILLMERYLNDEECWSDTQEHHYGWTIAFKTIIAANLSYFLPKNPIVQEKKKVCVHILQESIKDGTLNEDQWDRACHNCNDIYLKPYMVYSAWLLQNNRNLDQELECKYLEYIWYRKDGIYYRTNGPTNKVEYLESKQFTTWLAGVENLSLFSLFPEFASNEVIGHLLHEIHRLLHEEVKLPAPTPIIGHYSETWRTHNARKNDLILRIMRVLLRYWM